MKKTLIRLVKDKKRLNHIYIGTTVIAIDNVSASIPKTI